ncbi:hypothetical protein [Solibacillus sp. FSL H8-0538]|uniref:hypothetical protein n=1 Tax=Solibacillus sp. FSL H8-0538 TaxID=2921400 RepID=UPI0030FBEBFC
MTAVIDVHNLKMTFGKEEASIAVLPVMVVFSSGPLALALSETYPSVKVAE